MTPVEVLREAAQQLRTQAERAETMMPGPWRVVVTDTESPTGVASCAKHPLPPDEVCDDCTVLETYSEWGVAPMVAMLHPIAALAIAELLDEAELYASLPHWTRYPVAVKGIALARAILGRSE